MQKESVNEQVLLELILWALNWLIYMYLWSEYFVGIQSIKKTNAHHSWNESQKLLLNKLFQVNIYPKDNDVSEYARKLGVSVANVKSWFHEKRRSMVSKARKHGMLRSMCQLITCWKYVLPRWKANSFPLIICVGSSSQANAWLQQVHFRRFNTREKEELKKAFETCPYPTPVVKAMLPKTFDFSLDKLTGWFRSEREKIPAEIQNKKCKNTKEYSLTEMKYNVHCRDISSKCTEI